MDKYFLRDYTSRKKEIEQLEELLNRTRADISTAKAPIISDLPKASSRAIQDMTAERIAKLLDLERVYTDKVFESVEMQEEVEKAFEKLGSMEKLLMRARYIEGKSWEQIAVLMNYSYRHITKLHGKILQKL